MMKFCMVTTFYPPYSFGGDATYIYRLSNELARRGHRVDVIHDCDAYYLAHPSEPTTRIENHPNVTVYPLQSRWRVLSPLATQQTGYPFFKSQIQKRLQSQNYDVIHFHNISLIGPAAFRFGSGIKLQTLHEHWLICPMHVLWKYDREVCTRPECFRCTIHGRRPPQLWRYTHFLERQLAHIDQFLAPSRFTRRKHLEAGLKIPITILPYFVPQEKEPGNSTSSDHPKPYFLFVGRLVKIKGLQTLIPIFRNYPQADLLIAGEGEYADELHALAQGAANIQFLGALPHSKLRAYYRNAIAVIMPSICYEVFGIVLIEAFSVKTPVIVRDLGGMPEAVEDSNGGFVYRTDEELVRAMRTLHEDASLRQALGENGHAAYLKLWGEEAHLQKYFDILGSIARIKQHN